MSGRNVSIGQIISTGEYGLQKVFWNDDIWSRRCCLGAKHGSQANRTTVELVRHNKSPYQMNWKHPSYLNKANLSVLRECIVYVITGREIKNMPEEDWKVILVSSYQCQRDWGTGRVYRVIPPPPQQSLSLWKVVNNICAATTEWLSCFVSLLTDDHLKYDDNTRKGDDSLLITIMPACLYKEHSEFNIVYQRESEINIGYVVFVLPIL